jgi:hypothetical protein
MVKPHIVKNRSELVAFTQTPGQIAGRLEGAQDLDNSSAQRSEIGASKQHHEFAVLSNCALRILAGSHSQLTPSPAGLPPRQRPLAPARWPARIQYWDGAIIEANLCEMVREQLRLIGHRVGELSLEYFRDVRIARIQLPSA